MHVFLDDRRATPFGWVRVFWPYQAIELLETGEVEVISLDYDLGDHERGTGYDVLVWIEEAVRERGFAPPEIRIHSADRIGRVKMQKSADAIILLHMRRTTGGAGEDNVAKTQGRRTVRREDHK